MFSFFISIFFIFTLYDSLIRYLVDFSVRLGPLFSNKFSQDTGLGATSRDPSEVNMNAGLCQGWNKKIEKKKQRPWEKKRDKENKITFKVVFKSVIRYRMCVYVHTHLYYIYGGKNCIVFFNWRSSCFIDKL